MKVVALLPRNDQAPIACISAVEAAAGTAAGVPMTGVPVPHAVPNAKTVGASKPLLGTLTDVEARTWYHAQEDAIPGKINTAQPVREQALEAFQLRNQARTDARELMSNRELAGQLDITDPNLTLKQIVQRKYQIKGLVGDELWVDILKSSTTSRPSVDKSLGLNRKK